MSNARKRKEETSEEEHAASSSLENKSTSEPPARARRGTNSEETRGRILEAAQALFAMNGFDGTSTKAIAQRAEVPHSLIFYYFPSKKALLESLICERSILRELKARTDTLLVANLRSSLIELGTCYLELLKQNDRLSHILLREFRTHTVAAAELQAHHEEHVQLITSYLLKATHMAQCPPVERPGVIARVFYYNIIVIAFIEEIPEPLRFIENMVDLLLNGMLTRVTKVEPSIGQ